MFEKEYYLPRKGTNSMKWDGMGDKFASTELLPLWVADMDFCVPLAVKNAVLKLADTGIYGYYQVPQSYFNSIVQWQSDKHRLDIKREWICFAPGIIPAIHALIHVVTDEGDVCMVLAPCYRPFLEAPVNTGRKLFCHELIEDADGRYGIDFERFEADIVENDVKLLILCSPHNPTGRVFSAEELGCMLKICKACGVFVISDEVHEDVIVGKRGHIPSLKMCEDENGIAMLVSASKTFNLAGCQNASAVIPQEDVKKGYEEYIKNTRIIRGNMFGYVAAEAAYMHGEGWLKEVLKTIKSNYEYMRERLKRDLPSVKISPMEGTYLMWADFGAYIPFEDMRRVFEEKCGVAVYYGDWFWADCARKDTHVRINLATSRDNVVLATEKIVSGIRDELCL